MPQTITLIRGLPGSGKSTLAKVLASATLAWHYEADQYFMKSGKYVFKQENLADAHADCFRKTKNALMASKSVVVSNTFSRVWEMEPYINLATELNIPLHVIECRANFGSIHNVPENVVQNMKKRWETFHP